MKYSFYRVLSVVLVAAMTFSFSAPVFAGYEQNNLINTIYSNLSTAHNIVAGSRIYTELQNARMYLSQAQRLLKKSGLVRCFDYRLMRCIDKAKTQILWNDRADALEHIAAAMHIVENGAGNICPSSSGNHSSGNSGLGLVVAAPVIFGLGALIANLFGGISTRIPMYNVPGSAIRVQ
ncbi:MAG: hypothetical protein ACOYXC_04875 [Candidatus Rifleibacteriota bacterium]